MKRLNLEHMLQIKTIILKGKYNTLYMRVCVNIHTYIQYNLTIKLSVYMIYPVL